MNEGSATREEKPFSVFLDTMIYLHYRPVEDIDWCAILAVRPVEILVPRITVRELDLKKNSHPSAKIRDRASRNLAHLQEWFAREPHVLRSDVTIRRWPRFPSVSWLAELGLNREWNDDVLVGTVLDFRQTSGKDPILVTQDTGATLTARDHGVRVFSLPDKLKLPAELDTEEREIRDLRRQLHRLEAAQPRLELSFHQADGGVIVDGRLHARLRSRSDAERTDFVERIMTGANRKAPSRATTQTQPNLPTEQLDTSLSQAERLRKLFSEIGKLNAAAIANLGVAPEEVARYDRERLDYLREMEAFAKEAWDHEQKLLRSIRVSLLITNTGTQPADDVDVSLHVPDGVDVRPDAEAPPTAPNAPIPPRNHSEMMMDRMRPFHSYGSLLGATFEPIRGPAAASNISSLRIKRTNSFDLSVHVRRVKHGTSASLGDVVFIFPSIAEARSFGIEVRITAANLPEPIAQTLHVVIDQ